MVARFAGLFKPLMSTAARAWKSDAARAAIPRGWGGLAMDLAPNALYAGLAAAGLPEDTDMGDRAKVALEDFLVSVPLGWAGRLGGYGLARGGAKLTGRAFDPMSQSAGMIQGLSGNALEMGAYATGLVPRPTANRLWDEYAAKTTEQQQQEQAMRDEEIRRQAYLEMGGLGLLAAPFMQSPPGQGAMF